MENKKYNKSCTICGTEFKTNYSTRKFCSMKCKGENNRRKTIKYRPLMEKKVVVKCKSCKKKFTRRRINHKYCCKICREKGIFSDSIDSNSGKYKFYKMRFKVMRRDNFTCQYCGKNFIDDGIKINIDHIRPKKHDGKLSMNNLIVACEECNKGKRDILLEKHQEIKFKEHRQLYKDSFASDGSFINKLRKEAQGRPVGS